MLAGLEALVKLSELPGSLGPFPSLDGGCTEAGGEVWRAQIGVC